MTAGSFSLEHFYYGQPAGGGEPCVLAKSPGITDDIAAAAVEQVMLPALEGVADGAWAVTRGKKVPSLMVQAQTDRAGGTLLHYVILPPETLRAMSGNIQGMRALVEAEMPAYDTPGAGLEIRELRQAGPIAIEQQVDDILDLMTTTRNNLRTMESLLSAIVQGVQLIVVDAPPEMAARVKFIEGLLALLPPSTRFGVTFATHSLSSSHVDAQIRFLGDASPPPGTLVYNWSNSGISGKEVEDEYSHFIISQLRLDAELVTRQTEALTMVAAWRMRQGDRLADALGYASHRRKLDDALRGKQPVEIEDVSRVLAEDPTLTDSLRTVYARHVLALSLALDDLSHADPVAILLHTDSELSQSTLEQMSEALKDGKAGMIYETLLRWMANPLGPQGDRWIDLTHSAAILYLRDLVAQQDFRAIHDLLTSLQNASPGTEIRRIVSKVIELVLPLLGEDATLAGRLFVLAASTLDDAMLRRALEVNAFVGHLPRPFQTLWSFLTDEAQTEAPPGLVVNAIRSFPETWQPLVALRVADMVAAEGRPGLLDTPALGLISQAANTPQAGLYASALLAIVNSYDNSALAALPAPGPRYLLQILLALGEYRTLASEMIRHSRELFPGDLQLKYIEMVQRLFAETTLTPEQALTAIRVINEEGIKSLPLLVAATGALEAAEWAAELDTTADNVARDLAENPRYLEVINVEAIIALLTFYVKREQVANAIRVAGLVPRVAAYQGTSGLAVISHMYKLMRGESQGRLAGLQLLRRYVRSADDQEARRAIAYFAHELGPEVRKALEGSYLMQRFMGQMDIVDYAAALRRAGDFLQDTAAAYAEKNQPAPADLLAALDAMPGSMTREQGQAAAEALLAMGSSLVELARQFRANSPRSLDKHNEAILTGKTGPLSALDMMRLMGGYFARGRRYNLKLEPLANPFGERSLEDLSEAIEAARRLLGSAVQALPPDKPVKLSAPELREDLDSMWGELTTEQQRELVRGLAIDLQRIPELVALIAQEGDAKALEDSGLAQKLDTGKQRPRGALELYRFIHGYLRSRL